MMGGMGVVMLLGLLLFAVLIGIAVYLGVRAAQPRRIEAPTARDTLQQRLATGEITSEEYFERESVLRESAPVAGRRR